MLRRDDGGRIKKKRAAFSSLILFICIHCRYIHTARHRGSTEMGGSTGRRWSQSESAWLVSRVTRCVRCHNTTVCVGLFPLRSRRQAGLRLLRMLLLRPIPVAIRLTGLAGRAWSRPLSRVFPFFSLGVSSWISGMRRLGRYAGFVGFVWMGHGIVSLTCGFG